MHDIPAKNLEELEVRRIHVTVVTSIGPLIALLPYAYPALRESTWIPLRILAGIVVITEADSDHTRKNVLLAPKTNF